MNYYVVNKSRGITSYFNGTVSLQPEGQPRHTRRLPGFARHHADIKELEAKKKIAVLTEAEFKKYLKKLNGEAPKEEPKPKAKEAPKEEPKEEETPEPEAEEPKEEETPEPEAEEPKEEETAHMSVDDFTALKADEQREHLALLEVEGDMGNQEKRTKLYEDFLEAQS